jgi:hypothetical protein
MTTLSRRLRPAGAAQRTHASTRNQPGAEHQNLVPRGATPGVPAKPLPEAALAPFPRRERRLGPAAVAELGVGEAVPL